jgi:CheY-like chemotaxis protein
MQQQSEIAAPTRVLVVDDEIASGELLTEILTLEGFSVRVARSGNDALTVAREFLPGIALLDVGLPDMNGFELAKRFRSEPGLARVRLVALSGYAQPEARGFVQGLFDEYLVKPVDIEPLLSLLKRYSTR